MHTQYTHPRFPVLLSTGIGLIILLLLTIIYSIYHSRNLLLHVNQTDRDSQAILSSAARIMNQGLNDVDKHLRACVITHDVKYINEVKKIKEYSLSLIQEADKQIRKQKQSLPTCAASLDSSLNRLPGLEQSLQEYYRFCDQMLACKDSLPQVKAMLTEDRGVKPYLHWEAFYQQLLATEQRIASRQRSQYTQATNSLYLQTGLLFLLAIPVGFMLRKHLRRTEQNRQQIIESLDISNRTHLFDQGESESAPAGNKSDAAIIERTITHLQQAASFVSELSQGNFQVQWQGLTAANMASNKGNLADRLVVLRENLKNLKIEEEKRNWTNEGLTRFSVLVRNFQQQGSQVLSLEVTRFLAKYLGAQQASLFLVRQADQAQTLTPDYSTHSATSHSSTIHSSTIHPASIQPEESLFLELSACYAFDRKKFIEKRIHIGEGLVGQCYLEGETIFLTDIPQGYTHITSGLGDTTPTCLMVIPLKYNQKVEAVLEMAGFQTWQPHQIEFVEKAGEFVASALTSVKVAEQMKLLLEDTQHKTQELKAAEEEMRQNMEEMEATQEEMRKREKEMENMLSATRNLNDTMAVIEFDMDGKVLTANANFLKVMGYSLAELEGKHHRLFVSPEYANSEDYTRFWYELKAGKVFSGEFKRITQSGKVVWLLASYSPVKDREGNYCKVIKLAQDITQTKAREQVNHLLSLVADNTDNSVIITAANGGIEYINKGFERLTGYTLEEVAGRKPGSFLQGPLTDPRTVQRIREKLHRQEPFYEEILNYNKQGQTYWISLAINPVFDTDNKLEKFISVQTNITQTKLTALDYNAKLEAIEKSYGMIEFDIFGNIESANANFLELMGYSLDQIVGKHHSIFLEEAEKQSDHYQAFWKNLREKGGYVSGEFKRLNKKGETVWLRGSYNAIVDLMGQPYKVIKYAQDITHQKQLEAEVCVQMEELKATEEEIRQNLEELSATQDEIENQNVQMSGLTQAVNATLATIEFDTEGKILMANANFLSRMGYTLDQIIGKYHSIFVDPGYANSQDYVHFWEGLRSGKAQIGLVKRQTRSGDTVWLSASYTPVLNREGQVTKIIKFAQDAQKQPDATEENANQQAATQANAGKDKV